MNIAIDGRKLKRIMLDGFFNQAEVSRAIGYNSDYISQCINKCSMSQHAARVLKDKYSYYKPEKLSGREIIDKHCDFFVDANGIQVIVDYETVGAGVDIDELSALLSGNTSLIYQRVYEQLQKEKNNASTT